MKTLLRKWLKLFLVVVGVQIILILLSLIELPWSNWESYYRSLLAVIIGVKIMEDEL